MEWGWAPPPPIRNKSAVLWLFLMDGFPKPGYCCMFYYFCTALHCTGQEGRYWFGKLGWNPKTGQTIAIAACSRLFLLRIWPDYCYCGQDATIADLPDYCYCKLVRMLLLQTGQNFTALTWFFPSTTSVSQLPAPQNGNFLLVGHILAFVMRNSTSIFFGGVHTCFAHTSYLSFFLTPTAQNLTPKKKPDQVFYTKKTC